MKVLVPTDGSAPSLKAVERALELAEKMGAEITLMSVAYYAKDDFDDMPPYVQDKLEAEAAAALKKAAALCNGKGVKVNLVLEAGLVPANNIIRKATEEKFDRIIMGSTGLTGIKLALMGSTAAKVVAHAPCEVTVVR
jgi:nucleotide-binding universal stress UspA family protein